MISAKRFGAWLLAFSVFAICVATLTPVYGGGGPGTSTICVICGERGVADFLSNVVLFAPLGMALALRGGTLAYAAAVGVIFSGTVEALQFSVIAGRDTNIGDVVANGTGAVVGWALGASRAWWAPRPAGAMTRALTLTGIVVALLIVGLSFLQPAPPSTTYFLQWTPNLGLMPQYQGEVRSSALGPLVFSRPGRMQQSDSVRALLREPSWDVTFTTGAPPEGIAPIVSIYDEHENEVMLLGAAGADFVYRNRMRAATARLDAPDRRVVGAFAGTAPGNTVRLRFTADRSGFCLDINGQEHCGRGFTAGDTWSLLMFPDGWRASVRLAMNLFWLWLVFVPAGFLAVRTRLLALTLAGTAATLVAVPLLIGFAATPWLEIVAAWAGLMTGHLLARLAGGVVRRGAAAHGGTRGGVRPRVAE